MRAFELPPGALYRRAYWREVGLSRLVGLRPVFQGFTFPLAMFLASFLWIVCVSLSQRRGAESCCRWEVGAVGR